MSDDDFFDTPGGSGPAKQYSWPRRETSAGNIPGTKNGERSDRETFAQHTSDTDSDDGRRSRKSSSVTGSVTKVLIDKVRKRDEHSSDDTDNESDNSGKGRHLPGSPRRGTHSKSSSRSRSRSSHSGSSRSRSGSSSRSSSSEPEYSSTSKIKEAWNNEPTTKKPYASKSATRSSRSSTCERNKRNKSPKSGSSTLSESSSSDSDMTDVSPLNSPHRATPKTSPKKNKRVEIYEGVQSERKPPRSPMHKDIYSYKKPRPQSAHAGGYDHLLQADKDSVNLKVLMQAILEMEKERDEHGQQHSRRQKQFQVPHHAPSIASSVGSTSYYSSKRNFSFSNSRVMDIDRENQRLMNEILKNASARKRPQKSCKRQPVAATASQRLTPSAVNRLREQQRIDQENRAMLRRLESAKATKTLQRDQLAHELNTTTYVGVPLDVIHAPKSSKKSNKSSPYQGSSFGRRGGGSSSSRASSTLGSRTRSVSSLGSDVNSLLSESTMRSASTKSTVKAKRGPSSAAGSKPRPHSAHAGSTTRTIGGVPMRSKRPEWEAGW